MKLFFRKRKQKISSYTTDHTDEARIERIKISQNQFLWKIFFFVVDCFSVLFTYLIVA